MSGHRTLVVAFAPTLTDGLMLQVGDVGFDDVWRPYSSANEGGHYVPDREDPLAEVRLATRLEVELNADSAHDASIDDRPRGGRRTARAAPIEVRAVAAQLFLRGELGLLRFACREIGDLGRGARLHLLVEQCGAGDLELHVVTEGVLRGEGRRIQPAIGPSHMKLSLPPPFDLLPAWISQLSPVMRSRLGNGHAYVVSPTTAPEAPRPKCSLSPSKTWRTDVHCRRRASYR